MDQTPVWTSLDAAILQRNSLIEAVELLCSKLEYAHTRMALVSGQESDPAAWEAFKLWRIDTKVVLDRSVDLVTSMLAHPAAVVITDLVIDAPVNP